MVQAMAPQPLTASSRLKLVLSPTVAVEADSTSLKPEPTALCHYVSDGARHMKVTAVTQHGTSDLDTEPPLKQHAIGSGFMIVLRPRDSACDFQAFKVFAQEQVLHDDIQPLTSAGGLYQ